MKPFNETHTGNVGVPPPKTDKPRPHVCTTCSRSFARLEHLKRHERSHTKEKPFECPECTRCFARRDLLLRHQQKLHFTALPASRQKGARRESSSSAAANGSARVRKSSIANNTASNRSGSMRPRANTISHIDHSTIGMLATANTSSAMHDGANHALDHCSNAHGLAGMNGYSFRGMSSASGHHGNPHVLPKLETHGLNVDVSASLRTAPPYGGLGGDFEMENLWFGPGSTVNPAQLHFSSSPQSLAFDTPTSPYSHSFPTIPAAHATMDDEGNFAWLNGFESQISFNNVDEQAIDGSSPSIISTGSHSGLSEMLSDGPSHPVNSSASWPNPVISQASAASGFSVDWPISGYPEFFPPSQPSPKSLQSQLGNGDQYLPSPSPLAAQTPTAAAQGFTNRYFHPPMMVEPETLSNSNASTSSGSNRHSSVTSISTDSITDVTRQALLTSLSHVPSYNQTHGKISSSPLSPVFPTKLAGLDSVTLPSTQDLQRYVLSYVQGFHPHLPFIHIPSIPFDSAVKFYHHWLSESPLPPIDLEGTNGEGLLTLAMAAIGALYENNIGASKEIFDVVQGVVYPYLDGDWSTQTSAGTRTHHTSNLPLNKIPLSLVQVILLTVIYGFNNAESSCVESANAHCALLIGLARSIGFTQASYATSRELSSSAECSIPVKEDETKSIGNNADEKPWNRSPEHKPEEIQSQWHRWKLAEGWKRTMYALFIVSSLLGSGSNRAPALTNSEVKLDLPSDEELWIANSVEEWTALGGANKAFQRAISFASALSFLLTASQREQCQFTPNRNLASFDQSNNSNLTEPDLSEGKLQPSTFGCLVLINALHNYIRETRQRHLGRQWTPQETEAMHARVEPALRAWQAAWGTNPHHSLERPNPSGHGPLSADCIPLLDLAYVRLFVSHESSSETFWQHNGDPLSDEFHEGVDSTHLAGNAITSSRSETDLTTPTITSANQSSPILQDDYVKLDQCGSALGFTSEQVAPSSWHSLEQEHGLRKAAFYAVNSFLMSDKLGTSFADPTFRELPVQSALLTSDAAQVLAEWISMVQDRVGCFLGILGKDDLKFSQVPRMMFLDVEDCKLLGKIEELLERVESKLGGTENMNQLCSQTNKPASWNAESDGYASKLLFIMASTLQRAPVWPGKFPISFHFA